jgi:ABC-2 type transport system permease protein
VSALLREPPSVAQALRGFVALADKTARARAAYRAAILVTLFTSALGYVVFFLVWRELYRSGTASALMPKAELFSYLLVAFVLNFLLSLQVENRFGQRLRQGLITSDLLRPLGFLPFQLAQAVGDVVMNLLFALPVYAAGYFFLGSEVLPRDASSLALGLVSVALALLVNFSISYLLVQLSFVTQTLYGVYFARAALHQAFSGVAAPLSTFPALLGAWASAMPFRHVIETPARILLGQAAPAEIPALLLGQLAWGVGLLALSSAIFHSVLRQHQIQGG